MAAGDDGREIAHQNGFRDRLHARLAETAMLAPDTADRADVVFNLTKLFNRLGQDAESVHRKLGWTWAGFRIMNLLWAAGPMEARLLGRLSGASRATISSLLGTLERDGLVRRDRSDTDRRQVQVALTSEGHARLQAGLRAQADRDRAWLAALSEDEQRLLGDLLRRLADQPTP